jgi:HAMP domain-containing protein
VTRFGSLVFAITAVLVLAAAGLAGYSSARPVKELTRAAERISLGDLGVVISTRSKDEIGDLAHAIRRMTESIRLSIDRLRRKRELNAA